MLVQVIAKYLDLWHDIMRLDNIQHFDCIYLDSDDLKNNLAAAANRFSQMLLDKVAQDHRQECQR